MNTIFFVAIILSIATLFFVIVQPLFLRETQPYFTEEKVDKEFKESVALLETIGENNLDFEMGKLSKEEFDELNLEYQRKYLETKKRETAVESVVENVN